MSDNQWHILREKLGIDSEFTRGNRAEYYNKHSQIKYSGENPYEFWKKFFQDPADRLPLYKEATLGSDGTWRRKTLKWHQDVDGRAVIKMIQQFFAEGQLEPDDGDMGFDDTSDRDRSTSKSRRALLQVKVNGVHVMLKFAKKTGQDYFELVDVIGKQGPFDGVNARTASFREMCMALLRDLKIEPPVGIFPDDTEYILVQAELAKGVTSASHMEVCWDAMSYGNDTTESNRMKILDGLKLYVFNACIYRPPEGVRSESVKKIPLPSLKEFFLYCKTLDSTHFPGSFKVCPLGYFESLDEAMCEEKIIDFYHKFGPGNNGEGFIATFEVDGEVIKYKLKLVYSNNFGFAVEIPNGLLPVLYPPTGGKPVGLICAPLYAEKKCKQLIVTELMMRPYHQRENGFIYTGSIKWSAADYFLSLCEKAQVVSHHINRGVCTPYKTCFVAKDVEYMINKSLLDKYELKFLDLRSAVQGSPAEPPLCCLMYKGNQFINKYVDTAVLMGVYVQEEYDYPELVRKLQSEEDLPWEDKTLFQSYFFKDMPYDYSETADFLKSKLSTFGEDPKIVQVGLHKFLSHVGEYFRDQLKANRPPGRQPKKARETAQVGQGWIEWSDPSPGPAKRPRTVSRPYTVTMPNINALKMAYDDTGGIVDNQMKLGNLLHSFSGNSEADNLSMNSMIIFHKLWDGNNLDSKEKAVLTRLYNLNKAYYIDWLRKNEEEFRCVVEDREYTAQQAQPQPQPEPQPQPQPEPQPQPQPEPQPQPQPLPPSPPQPEPQPPPQPEPPLQVQPSQPESIQGTPPTVERPVNGSSASQGQTAGSKMARVVKASEIFGPLLENEDYVSMGTGFDSPCPQKICKIQIEAAKAASRAAHAASEKARLKKELLAAELLVAQAELEAAIEEEALKQAEAELAQRKLKLLTQGNT